MTAGGWVMFACSWAIILGLNAFCFYKLLTERPAESVTAKDEAADPQP